VRNTDRPSGQPFPHLLTCEDTRRKSKCKKKTLHRRWSFETGATSTIPSSHEIPASSHAKHTTASHKTISPKSTSRTIATITPSRTILHPNRPEFDFLFFFWYQPAVSKRLNSFCGGEGAVTFTVARQGVTPGGINKVLTPMAKIKRSGSDNNAYVN